MPSQIVKKSFFESLILFLILSSVTNCKTFEDDLTLTAGQKFMLDTFKSRVVEYLPYEYMKEDIYLIKWLRSSDFNMDVAELRLSTNLKWREQRGMDSSKKEDFSDMRRQFPYFLEGRDKSGRPVLYMEFGNWNVRRAVLQGNSERYVRYVNHILNDACTLVQDLGRKYKNITRGQCIINMQGYSPVQHSCDRCRVLFLAIFLTYRDHFPECFESVMIINSPSYLDSYTNSFKLLLSPDDQKAVQSFGVNKLTWKKALSRDFDFNQLPPAIGGKQTYKGMDDDY